MLHPSSKRQARTPHCLVLGVLKWTLMPILILAGGCGGGGGGSSTPGGGAWPGAFTAETDTTPIEVETSSSITPDSLITPALRGVDGYETILADDSSSFSFAGSPGNPIVTVSGTPPTILPGDIIVDVSTSGGDTIFRRVTAVNGTALTTEPASLEEAFPNATVNLDLAVFSPAAIQDSAPREDGRNPVMATASLLDFDQHLETEFVPGVSVVTDFGMNSTFDANLTFSIVQGAITDFSTSVNTNFSATSYLNVDFPLQFSQSLTKEFTPVFNKDILTTVPGLPIPLLVNVKLTPVLGADVNLSGATTLQYGYSASSNILGGFAYDGTDITQISDFSSTSGFFGPNYTLSGGVSVGAQATLALEVSIYEATVSIPAVGAFTFDGPGVGLSVGPYATFTATSVYDSTATPPFECSQDLSVGLSSSLSLDYGAIGDALGVSDPGPLELFDFSTSLWHDSACEDDGTGGLQGTVADETGSPLAGVMVTSITPSGEAAQSVFSDAAGFFQFDPLSVGTYLVEYSLTGYETATSGAVVTLDATATLSQVLVLDELSEGATGTVTVSVFNSQEPTQFVPGASLVFREGLNQPTGAFVAQVDAPSGVATIELPAGYYTVVVSAPGFAAASQSLALPEDESVAMSVLLSSESPPSGGEARIVLTWGENPSDLDSHLLTPTGHVYFANPSVPGSNLDVDDVTSYGPETVTIDSVDPNASYTYYVHHFAGSGTLATSSAVVTLYYGDTVLTYPVPPGNGIYWHVFDIVNGAIVPCNTDCISSAAPQGSSFLDEAGDAGEGSVQAKAYAQDRVLQ